MDIRDKIAPFSYDGLSRMLTSANPESGTVTNVYDTGSAGDLFTTTSPKPNASTGTVTACYGSWSGSSCTSSGWDAMHRLTYVSFSDGSNPTGYGYDSSNVWGTPVNNPKGRMVLANHATQGAALFSYDTGGRLINTWQCTPINCGTSSYPLSYTYNYVNQPQATTDAAGNTFTKAYNAAREVTSVQSSKTGTNYPQYLLNNISYNAFGEVVSATYGDGIVRTNTYDKMGRPTEIQDGPTNSPTYRLYVSYYGNGNVKTFNDTVSGGYTFTYDAFNRLVSSTNTAQSYSWTYDQFGNRWHQDKTAGTGYTVDLSFDSNNRINTGGYSYDVAGNLLKDGSACNPCWQYDDNGNLVSSAYGSSAASYSYDALGRRVERVYGGTTYDFVLDGSNSLDEYQGSVWPTVWSRTTGGAFTYANGTTYFNRTDNLGTPRVSTDYTGAVKRTETMGPFGDGFTESFAGLDFTGFAGGVWDQENNGDHFGAREYAKTQGRWLTPDPAGLAAVDPSNPQTWNRYAYVMNNPLSFTDPTGLKLCDGCHFLGSGGGGGCNMDGMSTPCDVVIASLGPSSFPGGGSMGGTAQCPNNNCGAQYIRGQWQYFGAWADGSSGYMPMSLAGFSTLDAANALAMVTAAGPKLGAPIDPTSLTGRGAGAYALLTGMGIAPGDITIYQNDGGDFEAVLSAQGFNALMSGLGSNPGDAFLHYPYTDGARDSFATNSLHGVWFDPNLTNYVGGSGVYMQFHTDADNPWQGSMWNHMMCVLFNSGCQ